MSDLTLDRELQELFAAGPRSAPASLVDRALARAATLPQRRARITRLDRRAWPPLRRSVSDPNVHRVARLALVALLVVLAGAVVAVGARLLDRPPHARLEALGTLSDYVVAPTVAVLKDGRLFVLGQDETTAIVLDPSSGVTSTIRLGEQLHGTLRATVLPDGRVVLIELPTDGTEPHVAYLDVVSGDLDVRGTIPHDEVFASSRLVLRDGRILTSGGVLFPGDQHPPCAPGGCEPGSTPPPILALGDQKQVTIFDPATGATTELTPLGKGRYQHHMLELEDGRILIVSGARYGPPSGEVTDVDVYDLATGASSTVGTFEAQDSFSALFAGPFRMPPVQLADGRVLIPRGLRLEYPCGEPTPASSPSGAPMAIHFESRGLTSVFDPRTNQVVDGPLLPHFYGAPSIVPLPDGRAVMFGQYVVTPGGCASDADAYSKSWVSVIDVRTGRVFESYDPTTGASALGIDPQQMYDASAVLPDGRVVLIAEAGQSRGIPNAVDVLTIDP
ncbi:MAG TPA: hypothetical protein VFP56_03420 [Candidatus Limnocylindrales bacterium]|nr:hypothetical protein [Candidatus Limnocylindrales bacterium]